MRYRLLFTFLFAGYLSFGQSDSHILVPGTKCSLIPPAGFVPATKFSGFQNEETGASIMINELPAPYQQLVESFTAEALKTRGMTLISKKTVDFNNSRATLFKVTQSANGTTFIKQILVFGDTAETVLVNGIYPEASRSMEEKMTDALFSTVYNTSHKIDPVKAAPYTINVEGTKFKITKFLSAGLIYTTEGKIPTDKPFFGVMSSFAKVPTSDRQQYAEERLKKLPEGEFSKVKEIREVTINNMKGYEIVADGKTKDGRPELVYQVMLFDDKDYYYIIIGQAKEDFDANLEAFRKIARSFKRK